MNLHWKITFILLFTSIIRLHAGQTIILKSAPIVSVPVIKDNTVTYNVDFIFSRCPQDYFVYQNGSEQNIIIDSYGEVITFPDSAKVSSFRGEMKISTVESAMSMTNTISRIRFRLQKEWKFEEGWHFEASTISSTTLRLKLWAEMRPAVKIKSGKKRKG